MHYIIVGSGPCGASLSYLLSRHNYPVTLIERDEQLGGSWNSQWIDGKYWSENVPRVLTSNTFGAYDNNFRSFLYDLGIRANDFDNVYGTGGITHIAKALIPRFTFLDLLKLLIVIIIALIYIPHMTMQEFLDKASFSRTAHEAIRMFCILIQDIPNSVMLEDFLASFISVPTVKQFKEPNKWHTLLEDKLKQRNATILKNTEVIRLSTSQERHNGIVDNVWVRDRKSGQIYPISGDKVVLAIESPALLKIINASNEIIKHNWHDYNWIKKWCEESYYIGFGFQLHFDSSQEMPNKWCWSCDDDWTVIITNNGKWLKTKSYDPKVKAVWSCCIVAMDTMSRHIKKTANECTEKEVIAECIRQINGGLKASGLSPCKPTKTTISEGLHKENGRWLSRNTGFSRTKMGYLPMRGKIDNLFCLGSCTDIDQPGVTVVAKSVDASLKYLEIYEPHVKKFTHQNNQNYRLVLMLVIAACVLYYVKYIKLSH